MTPCVTALPALTAVRVRVPHSPLCGREWCVDEKCLRSGEWSLSQSSHCWSLYRVSGDSICGLFLKMSN